MKNSNDIIGYRTRELPTCSAVTQPTALPRAPLLLTYLLNYLLTYVLTYLLTSWSRVLLEKPTGFQLVKKFPAFYGTRRFITAATSARHLSLSCHQSISPGPRLNLSLFRNVLRFYVGNLTALRPTPKPEDQTLSAVRYCSFDTFAATLHIGGRSSIRNPRTRHAVVTGN